MKIIKKFWHWLRCEDEDGNPIDKPWQPFRYSEMIKYYPIHGTIGDDDILMLSHKLKDGRYETCYITIKQLRDAIVNLEAKN